MSSRGGQNETVAALPRYANPSALVGIADKNSIGSSATAEPPSVKDKPKTTDRPPAEARPHSPVAAHLPQEATCVARPASSRPPLQHSNADKLLSGVGVVYDTERGASSANAEAGDAVAASSVDASGKESVPSGGKKAVTIITPPKKILKPVGQAIADWGMIEEVGLVLLSTSAGMNSVLRLTLSLLIDCRAIAFCWVYQAERTV